MTANYSERKFVHTLGQSLVRAEHIFFKDLIFWPEFFFSFPEKNICWESFISLLNLLKPCLYLSKYCFGFYEDCKNGPICTSLPKTIDSHDWHAFITREMGKGCSCQIECSVTSWEPIATPGFSSM